MGTKHGMKLLKAFSIALLVMVSTAGQNIIGRAEEATGAEKIDVSKTATPLNSNDETTVNLSIVAPTLKYKQDVDLVFVVDASTGSDYETYATEAGNLLDALKGNQHINLKVGSIVFDGWGHDSYSLVTGKGDGLSNESGLVLATDTTLPNIKKAVTYNIGETTYHISHSNSEEPLRMANRWLEKDTSVESANKHIVFISDMLTYLYGGTTTLNNVDFTETPVSKNFKGDGTYLQQLPTDKRDLATLFKDYDAGTLQKEATWNTDVFSPEWSWNTFFKNIYQGAQNPGEITTEQYNTMASAEDCKSEGVTGYEKSLCLTKTALDTSVKNGYNVTALIDDSYYGTTANDSSYESSFNSMPTDFTKYMSSHGIDTTLRSSEKSIDNFLASLEEKIVVVFHKGIISDVIGHQFELLQNKDTNVSPFHLSYDNVEYTSAKIVANEWSFGAANDAGVYPFVVEYIPTSKTINLHINTELKDYKKLNFSYSLYLTDFSKPLTDLQTNESAIVNYENVDGKSFTSEFPKPTVQYLGTSMTSGIQISSAVSGRNFPTNETFDYALTADAANPVNGENGLTGTAKIGNITTANKPSVLDNAFGTGSFTSTGTYKYAITETKGTTEGFTYDASSYLWTVDVVNGTAHASASDPYASHPTHPTISSTLVQTADSTGNTLPTAKAVDAAAFANAYEATTPTTNNDPAPATQQRQGTPTTSANTGVDDRGTMIVFFGAMSVLIGMVFLRKKFSRE